MSRQEEMDAMAQAVKDAKLDREGNRLAGLLIGVGLGGLLLILAVLM